MSLLFGAGLATALVVQAPALAQATDADTAVGEEPASAVDWGQNAHGWLMLVVNNTPQRLVADIGTFSNVATASGTIDACATGTVRGVPSYFFSGPADMDVAYQMEDGNNNLLPDGAQIYVKSDFSGNVSALADTTGETRYEVLWAVSDKPIVMRIDTPSGNCTTPPGHQVPGTNPFSVTQDTGV
jgi:hypothetical protein